MRLRTLSALILALSLLVASAGRAEDKPVQTKNVSDKVKKELGEKLVGIVSGATKVEVFRLDRAAVRPNPPKTIGSDRQQWMIVASGREQGKEFANKLGAFVLDEATRTLSGAGGVPAGDVAFRLWKDKESVTVVVDFSQSWMLLVARDADGKQVKTEFGGFLFDAKRNFDDGTLYNLLHGLAVGAFPDDKELKAMKKPVVRKIGGTRK